MNMAIFLEKERGVEAITRERCIRVGVQVNVGDDEDRSAFVITASDIQWLLGQEEKA